MTFVIFALLITVGLWAYLIVETVMHWLNPLVTRWIYRRAEKRLARHIGPEEAARVVAGWRERG